MLKKYSMLKRWIYILLKKNSVAKQQGIGLFYSKNEIRGYYNDLTCKVCSSTELDKKGIPLTTISNNKKVYFPITIFQYGLGCYDLYLKSKDEKNINEFKKIVCWAEKNINEDGSWECFINIESRRYNYSSMCQAEGASLLYRAYIFLGQTKYLEMAERAIDFMLKDYNNGGTSIYINDKLYLEEYPQVPRRSVLNGWIFSVFGLYDAVLINENKYKQYFRKTVETLIYELKNYDIGFWSKYDCINMIASPAYHDLHIVQLKVLYDLTQIDEIKDTYDRFGKYKKSKFNLIKAIIIKLIQKLRENSDAIVIK